MKKILAVILLLVSSLSFASDNRNQHEDLNALVLQGEFFFLAEYLFFQMELKNHLIFVLLQDLYLLFMVVL